MKLDKAKLKDLKQKALWSHRIVGDDLNLAIAVLRDQDGDAAIVIYGDKGERILIAHGSETGRLSATWAEQKHADVVLCCYPKCVYQQHKYLPIPPVLRTLAVPLCVCVYWGWLFIYER
jgi:hypothetical protein